MKKIILLMFAGLLSYIYLQNDGTGYDEVIEPPPIDRGEAVQVINEGDRTEQEFRDIAQHMGVVYITGGDYKCTGTLLTNDIILTARHCVKTSDPGTRIINALLEGKNEKSRRDDQIRRVKHLIKKEGPDWTNDLALMVVEKPFKINGSTSGHARPLYSGSNEDLIGKTLLCYGYGQNNLTEGEGILRWAYLTVADYNSSTEILYFVPNKKGQILTSGDSGAACFYDAPDLPVATIHHKSDKSRDKQGNVISVIRDYESGPDTFRDWVSEQILSDTSRLNFYARIHAMGGRTIDNILYCQLEKNIPFRIKGDSKIGFSRIDWHVYKKNTETGELKTVLKKSKEIAGLKTADIKSGIKTQEEGTYIIKVNARDAVFGKIEEGSHETSSELTLKILDSDKKPVSKIIVKDFPNSNSSTFKVGDTISVIISAQSDIGLFQVGYGVQIKKGRKGFIGGVALGTRANIQYPDGAKTVQYNWRLTLDEIGTYRIYTYSRDILYGGSPGHQSDSIYHYIDIISGQEAHASSPCYEGKPVKDPTKNVVCGE